MPGFKSVNVVFAGCAATVFAGWLSLLVLFATLQTAPVETAVSGGREPTHVQHGQRRGTHGLAGPMAGRLKRPVITHPTFTHARLSHTTGRGLFAGYGEANAHLILLRGRRAVANTRVNPDGKWQLATAIKRTSGSYEFSLEQRLSGVDAYTTGERLSITIPEGFQHAVNMTSNGEPAMFKLAAVRAASEDLGSTATKRFDHYFKTNPGQQATARRIVNQSIAARGDILEPAWKWLEDANRSYHQEVVPRIKRNGYTTTTEPQPATGRRPRPRRQAESRSAARSERENWPSWGDGALPDGIADWFAAARRGYSTEIVPRLKGKLPSVIVARPRDDEDTAETEAERRAKAERRRRMEQEAVAKAERERREAERRRREAMEQRRAAELEARKLAAEERRAVERRAAAERQRREAERLAAAERDRARAAAAETAREAEERREREAKQEAERLAALAAQHQKANQRAAAEREREAARSTAQREQARREREARRRQAELERQRELNRKLEADSQRQRETAEAKRRRQAALELMRREAAQEEARRRQAELNRQREANRRFEADRKRQREAAERLANQRRLDRLARTKERRQSTATERSNRRNRRVVRDTEIEFDSKQRSTPPLPPRRSDSFRDRIRRYIFRDTVIEYGDQKTTDEKTKDTTAERRRLALGPPTPPTSGKNRNRGAKQAGARAAKTRRRKTARHTKRNRRSRRCHARAGRRISPPGTYIVRRGDSLWRISRRHYRLGKYYRTIHRANRRKIQFARLIYPCQRFHLPRKARR
jgi:colicin import membrane protein